MACDVSALCYSGADDGLEESPQTLWDRITWFPAEKARICTRRSLTREAAREICRSRPTPSYDRGWSTFDSTAKDYRTLTDPANGYINVTDCDELYASIDPTCSFDLGKDPGTGEDWNVWFAHLLVDTQKFMLTFWIKPVESDSSTFAPWVIFYSSLNPLQAVVEVVGRDSKLNFFNSCRLKQDGSFEKGDIRDNIFGIHDFPTDEWTMITIMYTGDPDVA